MPPRKTSRSKSKAQKGKGPKARKLGRKAPGRKDAGALFKALVALQARLCAPNGCPWDREQTHDTLRPYLIEESYEVLNALDSGDPQKFAGELGDLLLQIIFHSYLAAKAGRFDIGDVIEGVHNKMVRRHPHVFGEVKARTSAQVLKNWEVIKAEERRAEAGSDKAAGGSAAAASVLDAVPRTLPALLEAHQLTRRAANVGFDWPDINGVLEKLEEEARELREALPSNNRDLIEGEVGDVLFVGVNLARFLKLDAEIALKKTNRKFSRRFRAMEQKAASGGGSLAKLSADELEGLWREAKTGEAAAASAGPKTRSNAAAKKP